MVWVPLACNAPACQHGLLPWQLLMLLATCGRATVLPPLQKCPGGVHLEGHGQASVVAAQWNVPGQRAPELHVVDGVLLPQISSRGYLADSCQQGPYNGTSYLSLKLLGRTFKYTVDLTGAECGCNVAVYLTAMKQNGQEGACGDYYCDSNHVCGVACSEIDIQEANQHAWHSTLDAKDDGQNVGCGIGGDVLANCSWTPIDYGVGGRCVDTVQPFHVAASFPVNSKGLLKGIHVKLSQPGKPCNLETRINSYMERGVDGMVEMSKALAAGMTPIVSYWSSTKMLWMDGTGMDDTGYCTFETPGVCKAAAKVYGFAIEDISQKQQPLCERCPVGHCSQSLDGECTWFAGAAFKGQESYHCLVAGCEEVPRGVNISTCWKWQGKAFYSISFKNSSCLTDPLPKLSSKVLQVAKLLEGNEPIPTTLSTTTGTHAVTHLILARSSMSEVRKTSKSKGDTEAPVEQTPVQTTLSTTLKDEETVVVSSGSGGLLVEHIMDSWESVPGNLSQSNSFPFMGILTLGGTFMFFTMLLLLLRVFLQRGSLTSSGVGLSTDVECASQQSLLVLPQMQTTTSQEMLAPQFFH